MALTRVYGGGRETTKGERLGVRRDGDGLYVVTRCGFCRSNGTATATNECRLALAETYCKRPELYHRIGALCFAPCSTLILG